MLSNNHVSEKSLRTCTSALLAENPEPESASAIAGLPAAPKMPDSCTPDLVKIRLLSSESS